MRTKLLICLNMLLMYSLSFLEVLLSFTAEQTLRASRFVGTRGFNAWKRDADLRYKAGL